MPSSTKAFGHPDPEQGVRNAKNLAVVVVVVVVV
jgi:hypothetical protein